MNKYYNINNLFDENGDPIKVTIKIKRKNNQIDYKTAYETSFECNKILSEKYNELKKQKDDVVEYIKKDWYSKNTRDINRIVIGDWRIDILRMLGEIE